MAENEWLEDYLNIRRRDNIVEMYKNGNIGLVYPKSVNLPVNSPYLLDASFGIENINNFNYLNYLDIEEDSQVFKKINETTKDYLKKLNVNNFAERVKKEITDFLKKNKNNIDLNLFDSQSQMAVLSVDIRKSTHLMETARSNEAFADFMALLTADFKKSILANYGVFDKFTGDGLLCYFPEFCCGEDYLYYAVNTAQELHRIFIDTYEKYEKSFEKVFSNAGLGIGIDAGPVLLKMIGDELTIIGKPVINACRLNSAPVAITYVNKPTASMIKEKYGEVFTFLITDVEYKNEDSIKACVIAFNENTEFKAAKPDFNKMLKIK